MTATSSDHNTPWKSRFKTWWRLRKDATPSAKKLLWAIFTGRALKWQEQHPHFTFFNMSLDNKDRKDLTQMLHAKDAPFAAKGNIADMFGPRFLIEEALTRKNSQMLDDVLWAPNVAQIFYGQELFPLLAQWGTQAKNDNKRWANQQILERLNQISTFQEPLSHGLSIAFGAASCGQEELILWLWKKNLLPKHPKDVTDKLCQTLAHTASGQLLHKIMSGMSHHDAIKLTAQAAILNEKSLVFKLT